MSLPSIELLRAPVRRDADSERDSESTVRQLFSLDPPDSHRGRRSAISCRRPWRPAGNLRTPVHAPTGPSQ